MEYSWALLALISLLTLAFITKINFYDNRQPKRKLPPSPKPWPIIGNLNLLGSILHQSLHSLSQKYGEIMLLKFGNFPVVVASSPEMAKQFLKVHDAVFAYRPPLSAGRYNYNFSDMLWAPYGPRWKQSRKIFHSEVFSPQRLGLSEKIRVEERRDLLSRLRSQYLSGQPVVLKDHLWHQAVSTICRMVFGIKYFGEGEEDTSFEKLDELKRMLDEWFFLNGVINVGDWIPWLSFLDLHGYVGRMKVLSKKFDRLYEHVIDDHQAATRTDEEMDMVNAMLQQAEDPNLEVPLTRDRIKALLHDLLAAGTDTTATTIQWAILEIMRQPRIIEKAKDELDRVIGRNRWVEENDVSQLPYLEAIIMETFRLHPVSALLAPHYAIEDCNVSGYDIAKGTMAMINTWSIGRDPETWDAPQEFLPERFIGNKIDIMGSNFALLPFGSGRRRCPGYSLALKVVRTTLANLLHGFEMKLVEEMRAEDICMDEVYALGVQPKQSLSIIMEPTLPAHLY